MKQIRDNRLPKKAKSYGNIKTNSQYEYYKQFEKFGRSEYETLFEYSSEKGIIAFSTPFDPENAQMLNSLDMPLYKIASCDLLYKDLLREVACFQKPIILSTGGSTLEEINRSLEILYSSGAEEIALLACTLSYPTKTDDANYRKITKLINEFPKKPKIILTGVSVLDDAFKIWMAHQTTKGTHLIISQNGGGYGVCKFVVAAAHDRDICDQYFTWGWKNPDDQTMIPLSSARLSSGKYKIKNR